MSPQEQFDFVGVRPRHATTDVERRCSIFVDGVDPGSVFQQKCGNLGATQSHGFMQRRGLMLVPGIHIRPGGNQEFRNLHSTPERRAVQRGFTTLPLISL